MDTNSTQIQSKDVISSSKIKKLALAGLFAALSYIGFQFFRIDIAVGPAKTAFHLGNTFVVLAALFLGGPVGGLSGAVGLSFADLTSGYATYAPETFFLKFMIGLITGLVAYKGFKINTITSKKKLAVATIVSAVAGLLFNVVADPIVGYFYQTIFIGLKADIAQSLAKISSVTTGVNALLSVIFATVLYLILRPILRKANLFN